jgi:hypothetical protein
MTVIGGALTTVGAIIEGLATGIRVLIAGLTYVYDVNAAVNQDERNKVSGKFDRAMQDILNTPKTRQSPADTEYGSSALEPKPAPYTEKNPFGFNNVSASTAPIMQFGPPTPPPAAPAGPVTKTVHISFNVAGNMDKQVGDDAARKLSGLSVADLADAASAVSPP